VARLEEIDLSLPDEDLHHLPRHQTPILPELSAEAVDWLRRTAWTILVLAVLVFLLRGVNRVQRPQLVPNQGALASQSAVPGFDQTAFEVNSGALTPGLTPVKHCALLATTRSQQEKGLMFRHDLAGYDGIVFQWSSPTTVQFWMKDTYIPLSIAWFDPTGHFVSAADMAPCRNPTDCPVYSARAPYTIALEVPQGQLGQLGIGPGSSISVGGGCAT
jgi:uncharacterized membrane protein (UPF0127 family)